MADKDLENKTGKMRPRSWIPKNAGVSLLGGINIERTKESIKDAYNGPSYTERILGDCLRHPSDYLIDKGK